MGNFLSQRAGRRADRAVGGRGSTIGQTARTGELADGMDRQTGGRGGRPVFKRCHSSTPFHSWAPSPLASSERECVGCLGVHWGPGGFLLKHPYLAPKLASFECEYAGC